MNCVAGRAGQKYANTAKDRQIKLATRYFSVVTAKILLSKFHWANDKVLALLTSFFDQFHAIGEDYINVEDYATILRTDYDYAVVFHRPVFQSSEITPAHRMERMAASLSVQWIAEILAVTLLDKYNWNLHAWERFQKQLEKHFEPFSKGGQDYSLIVDGLCNRYGFDIRMHIR